jgi:hypothetical protein
VSKASDKTEQATHGSDICDCGDFRSQHLYRSHEFKFAWKAGERDRETWDKYHSPEARAARQSAAPAEASTPESCPTCESIYPALPLRAKGRLCTDAWHSDRPAQPTTAPASPSALDLLERWYQRTCPCRDNGVPRCDTCTATAELLRKEGRV